MSNGSQDVSDTNGHNGLVNEDEKNTNTVESSNDDINDSETKQEVSSGEAKSVQPTVSSATEQNRNSKSNSHEETEEKRRTSNYVKFE